MDRSLVDPKAGAAVPIAVGLFSAVGGVGTGIAVTEPWGMGTRAVRTAFADTTITRMMVAIKTKLIRFKLSPIVEAGRSRIVFG